MKTQIPLTVACLVGIMMMVGCGADEATQHLAMTKVEFRQRANETCYEANRKIYESASRAKRLERILVKAILVREGAFREFSKLRPPVDVQPDFVAFKQTVAVRNRISNHLVDKLRRGDIKLGRPMGLLNKEMTKARVLASRLKLSDCPIL